MSEATSSPDATGWWRRLRSATPIQAWLLHCLLVFATAGITEWLTPGRDHLRPRHGGFAHFVLNPLTTWDGAWYLRIAADGYAERQSAAFFPLYPLLIRFLSTVTGLSHPASGLVISNLAFLAALFLLYRLVGDRYGSGLATRATWLLALTPMGFFFSALYTESLFLCLSLAAVVLAREGRWTSTAIALALVTLTRSAGVFVIVPVLAALIEQRGVHPRGWLRPGIQLAAGMAAPLVFAAHLHRLWGDALLMSSIQSEWSRAFSWPWMTLWNALDDVRMHFIVPRAACTTLVRDGRTNECLERMGLQWDTLSDDFGFVFTVAAFALLIVGARRLHASDAVYASLLVLFPLFNPSIYDYLLSMPRYSIVAWPLFVVLAMLLARRWLYLTVLAVSALLMGGLLALHSSSYFVS